LNIGPDLGKSGVVLLLTYNIVEQDKSILILIKNVLCKVRIRSGIIFKFFIDLENYKWFRNYLIYCEIF